MKVMLRQSPWKTFLLGLVLVLLGVVVPLLMVLEVIGAGFLLSFIAYGASIAGLFIGFLGAASFSLDIRP